MKKFKNATIFVLILILSIVLIGCTENKENDPVEGLQEKTIRLGVVASPKIDPAVGTDAASVAAIINLYDSLVYPNPDGTMKAHLADSWKVDEQKLNYTFNLQKGVKFHNGEELTASDVVFSANRLLTIGEGFAYLFDNIIEDVVAVEDYVVKFTLSKPYAPFLRTINRIYILSENEVMKNIDKNGPYGDYGDYGKAWLIENDAGSGAYTVTEVKQQQYMSAVRFDNYWGGWNNVNVPDSFKLINISEAATTHTMMRNQDLEITDLYQSTESIESMSKIPGVSTALLSVGAGHYMMYNNQKAPTDDVNFRKALNYLYDYDMLSKDIFIDSPQSTGPIPATIPESNPNLLKFSRDTEKAREYLEKSKYSGKLDQYPVEFLINSTVPDQEKIALELQSIAKTVGIKVEISKGPWLSIMEQVASVESTPNIVLICVPAPCPEAGAMLATRYHSNSVGTWEQSEWLLNDDLDMMIEDALSTINDGERIEKYYKIQEIIAEEITPSGWLVDTTERCVYQSGYVKWPVAEQKDIVTLPLGYMHNFREMEVYPDKRNK